MHLRGDVATEDEPAPARAKAPWRPLARTRGRARRSARWSRGSRGASRGTRAQRLNPRRASRRPMGLVHCGVPSHAGPRRARRDGLRARPRENFEVASFRALPRRASGERRFVSTLVPRRAEAERSATWPMLSWQLRRTRSAWRSTSRSSARSGCTASCRTCACRAPAAGTGGTAGPIVAFTVTMARYYGGMDFIRDVFLHRCWHRLSLHNPLCPPPSCCAEELKL